MPEALEGALDTELVVLMDQAADEHPPTVRREQPSVELEDGRPGGFVALVDGAAEELDRGGVGAEPADEIGFFALRFGAELSSGRSTSSVSTSIAFDARLGKHVATLRVGRCRHVTGVLQAATKMSCLRRL